MNGIDQRFEFVGTERELLFQQGVDLVVDTDFFHVAVAVVADRDRERRAVACHGANLGRQHEIDNDGFDGELFLGAGHRLAAARKVFHTRLERHVKHAHPVFHGNGNRFARAEFAAFQRDRLHALLGIVKLQRGNIELRIVADRIDDRKRLVAADVGILTRCGNGEFRHNKALDQNRGARVAAMCQKRRLPGFRVDDGFRFLPFETIRDVAVQLIFAHRDVVQMKLLRRAGKHGDRFVKDHLPIFKPARKLCVFQRIVLFGMVADGKQQIGDRAFAFQFRHRFAGDFQRDRMLAVGKRACRQKNARKHDGKCDQDQNPLHPFPPIRFNHSPSKPESRNSFPAKPGPRCAPPCGRKAPL